MRHVIPLATSLMLLGACTVAGPTVPIPSAGTTPGAPEGPTALASGVTANQTPPPLGPDQRPPALTPSGAPNVAPVDASAQPNDPDPAADEGLVSAEAFEAFRTERGGIELLEGDEGGAEDRARDEAEFKAFLAANPKRETDFAITEDPENRMKVLPNGNIAVQVKSADGGEETLELGGADVGIGAMAATLRAAESIENQAGLYASLFASLTEEERAAALDTLDGVTDDWLTGERTLSQADEVMPTRAPERFPAPQLVRELKAEQVARLNTVTAAHFVRSLPTFPKRLKPEGYIGDPDMEIGAGSGADRGRYGGRCDTPSPLGLFTAFEGPGKYFTTSVKSHGLRPTSASFAMISAIEMQVAQDHGQWVNLSEQDFTFRLHTDWWPRASAGRHDLAQSWQKAKGYRVPTEAAWEYNPSPTCEAYSGTACSETPHQGDLVCMPSAANPSGRICLTASGARQSTIYGPTGNAWDFGTPTYPEFIPTFARHALANRAPVMVTFRVTPAFLDAPDGYLASDGSGQPNYGYGAAHVIGYMSNEEVAAVRPSAPVAAGGGYFIVKWSQGTCAGDAGYKYVSADYLVNHGTQCVVVTPDQP